MHRRFVGSATAVVVGAMALFASSAMATTANPNTMLSSVSCATAADCTAVGAYDDGIDFGHGLLLSEKNGSWSRGVAPRLPQDASPDPMPGLDFFNGPSTPVAKALNGALGLLAVSCPKVGDCTAIGNYVTNRGKVEATFLDETDGHWQRGIEAKLPSSLTAVAGKHPNVLVNALACTSVGNCTAAGTFNTDRETNVLMFTEHNGHWSAGIAPIHSTKHSFGLAVITSISCPAAGHCTAVGQQTNREFAYVPLLFTQRPGHWSVTKVKLPTNSQTTMFAGSVTTSISCPHVGACTISGSYETTRDQYQMFVAHQTVNGFTRAFPLKPPAGATITAQTQSAEIDQLVCQSASECSGAGSYVDTDDNLQGLLLTEHNARWAPSLHAALPAPFGRGVDAQQVIFGGLSCASAGNCVATGSYYYGGLIEPLMSLVDTEQNGVWSKGANAALPGNHAHVQANDAGAVSCAPGVSLGDCTLIGNYTDIPANWQGYAASGTGGEFTHASQLRFPGLNRQELANSLFSVLQPLGASLTSIHEHGGYTFDFTAPTRGRLGVTWHADTHGRPTVAALDTGVAGQGIDKVRLTLTAAGRKLFAGSKRLKIVADASFKAPHYGAVDARTTFTLSVAKHRHGGSSGVIVINAVHMSKLRTELLHAAERRHL